MPEKLNKVTLRGLQSRWLSGMKAAPFILLLLKGNTVLAQSSSSTTKAGSDFSAGEVLVLIAGIVLLILIAWFFGSGQSKGEPPVHNHPHKHYEHPNDPHFRKLKKKTS